MLLLLFLDYLFLRLFERGKEWGNVKSRNAKIRTKILNPIYPELAHTKILRFLSEKNERQPKYFH